jgi:hypothetical protein
VSARAGSVDPRAAPLGREPLRRDPSPERSAVHIRAVFVQQSVRGHQAILCEHLDLLGIRWTRPNAQQIAIATRRDVDKLDDFVGAKR